MSWVVDGCPELGEFATEGEALAAAWSQTMPGGKRPGIRERANDPAEWRGPEIAGNWLHEASEIAGVQMTPVKGMMTSYGHGERPVLTTTLRAPRQLAELVVHGVEGVEEQRKAYYGWIVRTVTPKLRAENPFPMHDYEDLSVGVETMFFEGATFIADVEAVIISLPRMKVR